jgi:hypothetical protein
MKKIPAWLTVILMAVGLGLLAPGSASAASYCGQVWGSLAKANQTMSTAAVTNVRTGQHFCFDRLVIDLKGKAKGYNVRYVSKVAQEAPASRSSSVAAHSFSSPSTRRPMTMPPARPPSFRPTGPR